MPRVVTLHVIVQRGYIIDVEKPKNRRHVRIKCEVRISARVLNLTYGKNNIFDVQKTCEKWQRCLSCLEIH